MVLKNESNKTVKRNFFVNLCETVGLCNFALKTSFFSSGKKFGNLRNNFCKKTIKFVKK